MREKTSFTHSKKSRHLGPGNVKLCAQQLTDFDGGGFGESKSTFVLHVH